MSETLTSYARKNHATAWINSGMAVVAMVLLYGLMPFTSSYDQHIRTLAYTFWFATQSFDGQWEHCLMVPPIIAVMIYLKREELATIPAGSAWSGLVLTVMGALFFWIGVRTEVIYFGYISIQLFLIGSILWVGGWNWLKALAFPCLFLVFAWPLIFLDTSLAFPLRIFMTKFAHVFLNIIGVDNLQVGTAIVSVGDSSMGIQQGQKFAVDIANPCSGIRSLFALVMLSALFGYFGLEPDTKIQLKALQKRLPPLLFWWALASAQNWRRWILFASALPLAVFGNFVRILLLTFGTMLFGSSFAIGTMDKPSTFHMFSGFFVFAVALGGMFGLWWILQNFRDLGRLLRIFLTAEGSSRLGKSNDGY